MPKIFINARLGKSAGHAERLFARLQHEFGPANVSMDETGISPGFDFRRQVEAALSTCDVLVVLMGRDWASCVDGLGRRRIELPSDFVGVQVSMALRRGVRVVPVLVQQARLPSEADLPDDLRPLLWRRAFELRDPYWDADLTTLSLALARTAANSVLVTAPNMPAGRGSLLAGISALMVSTAGAWFVLDEPSVSEDSRFRHEPANGPALSAPLRAAGIVVSAPAASPQAPHTGAAGEEPLSTHRITVRSIPSGAVVRKAGVRLGTTPFVHAMRGEHVELELTLRGYPAQRVRLRQAGPRDVLVQLASSAKQPSGARSEPHGRPQRPKADHAHLGARERMSRSHLRPKQGLGVR